MDTQQVESYESLGKKHWWLTGKYEILIDLLTQNTPAGLSISKMLDIGCAGGVFLERTAHLSKKQFGSDYNQEILSSNKPKGIPSVASDISALPFKSETFDLVCAIDILEHIEHDDQGISEIYRVLSQSGLALLSVPAFQILFGKHDELFGHLRRYTKTDFTAKLRHAGFNIIKATYIQPLFFLPLLIKRRLLPPPNNNLGDFSTPPEWANRALHSLLAAERFPLRMMDFPFGATLLVLASKQP